MTRVDLMDLYHEHYAPSERVDAVLVPPRSYVVTDVSADFRSELSLLRQVADALTAAADQAGWSYGVMPLEGLWPHPETALFDPTALGCSAWTAAVCLPPTLDRPTADRILSQAMHSLNCRMGMMHYGDGTAVQTAHFGPLEDSGPAIARLHGAIDVEQFEVVGPHHEIYLTDPLTTAPEAMCTIVRQGIRARPLVERPWAPHPLFAQPERSPRRRERPSRPREPRGGR